MTDRFKRGGRGFFGTRWGYAAVTFVIVVIVFTLLILTGWLKPDRGATSGSRSPSPILLIRFLVFLVLIPLRFLWSRFRSAGHSDPSAPTKDPDVGYPRAEDHHTETIHLGTTPYAPYASHGSYTPTASPGDPRPPAIGTTPTSSASSIAAAAAAAIPVSASKRTIPLVKMLERADDAGATLADMTRHTLEKGVPNRLAEALELLGVTRGVLPPLHAHLLPRNGCMWLSPHEPEKDRDTHDALVATEMAINLALHLPLATLNTPLDNPASLSRIHGYLRGLVHTSVPIPPPSDEFSLAYPSGTMSATSSEWECRYRLMTQLESLPLPFRVIHELRMDLSQGNALIVLEVPRPSCLAVLAGRARQVAEARGYALRFAVIVARCAFEAIPAITHVFVSCRTYGSDEDVLALSLSRSDEHRLQMLAASEALDDGMLPTGERAISFTLGQDGWFLPMKPSVTFDDERISPTWRRKPAGARDQRLSPALASVTGTRTTRGLEVLEEAARMDAYASIADKLGTTTESAVAALVALKDASEDDAVRTTCSETIQRLLSGTMDVGDTQEIALLFMSGARPIDQAFARAERLSDADELDPRAMLDQVEGALTNITRAGRYQDDKHAVWRYFESVAERIEYNLMTRDDPRELRLVPTAYYKSLLLASRAHRMMGEFKASKRYASEMLRIGPICIDTAMELNAICGMESRFYDAADALIRCLEHAMDSYDIAWLHYRLALTERSIGRDDLAVACYTLALTRPDGPYPYARRELDEFLRQGEGLSPMELEEASKALCQAGIPTGLRDDAVARMRQAATLCCDAGIFPTARALVMTLHTLRPDDVLADMASSLA